MSTRNALILIDANKYLDLYRADHGKKLLRLLSQQADYIFITEQIVREVQRNKIEVVSNYLKPKFEGVKLQRVNVPDHLSGNGDDNGKGILKTMKDIGQSVKELNSDIDHHVTEIISRVARSEDEVSQGLNELFISAEQASDDELCKARLRKELGNPPGKRNDPLGDEVTWEQLITRLDGIDQLWIISRDGDYGTTVKNKTFLNAQLRAEVEMVSKGCSVNIFTELSEGLKHFVETRGIEVEEKLSAEEVEELENEERSLASWHDYISQIQKALPNMHIQAAIDALRAAPALEQAADIARAYSESIGNMNIPSTHNMLRPESLQVAEAVRQAKIVSDHIKNGPGNESESDE